MTVAPERPPLARQHTRKTEAKRTDALDQGVSIELDGEVYEVRAGDLTAVHSRMLRRECGVSFVQLMDELTTACDIDSIAVVIWLARRLRGEELVSYEDVANGIDYSIQDRIVVKGTEAEDSDSPEA